MTTPIQEHSVTIFRRADITDPDDLFAWYGLDRTLRDLSQATLTMEIIDPATNLIQYTKTAGIIGNDGTTPSNLVVAWESAEMLPLVGRKRWRGRIIAVEGTERAEFALDAEGTLPVWVFEAPPSEPPEVP